MSIKKDKEIENICLNNGISESTLMTKLDLIQKLEMCHFNLLKIPLSISIFTNLKSLIILSQDLCEIQENSLCNLHNLEKLWICETKLQQISGLPSNLIELYAFSNQLKEITGLSHLVKLQVLWLNDNHIRKLSGLQDLKELKELHVANNQLDSIGHCLNHSKELKDLNMSGNNFSSFREILHLTRLEKLENLSLSDSNFADNPICSLCNYQTHVVYHLPSLKSLDTLEVCDDSRKMIAATVLKKRMYLKF
jgi:Leucine-rich repeat (LRR) protein